MTKQKIQKKEFCKTLFGKTRGFTLVELIIVITILSILSTIAFISFKNYSWNARDGNRITTLSNIQKWLDLYQIKTNNYPIPDNIYGTWVYQNNGEEIVLNYVGFINNTIAPAINMNTVPLDPIANSNYIYGTSYDQKYYQVATTLENNISYSISQMSYANSSYKAKVNGNYKWLLLKNNTIYNIPSLIFSNTWTVILTGNVFFVANNSNNLPYWVDRTISIQNSDSQKVLQLVTGKPSLSVTWVTIPQTTSEFEENKELYSSLWHTLNTIWKTIFWEKYEWNFIEDEEENHNPWEDCIFWEWNTSGSVFWECSL